MAQVTNPARNAPDQIPVDPIVDRIDYSTFQLPEGLFTKVQEFAKDRILVWVAKDPKTQEICRCIKTEKLHRMGWVPIGLELADRKKNGLTGKNKMIPTGWQEKLHAIYRCMEANFNPEYGKPTPFAAIVADGSVMEERLDIFYENCLALNGRLKESGVKHGNRYHHLTGMEIAGIPAMLEQISLFDLAAAVNRHPGPIVIEDVLMPVDQNIPPYRSRAYGLDLSVKAPAGLALLQEEFFAAVQAKDFQKADGIAARLSQEVQARVPPVAKQYKEAFEPELMLQVGEILDILDPIAGLKGVPPEHENIAALITLADEQRKTLQ